MIQKVYQKGSLVQYKSLESNCVDLFYLYQLCLIEMDDFIEFLKTTKLNEKLSSLIINQLKEIFYWNLMYGIPQINYSDSGLSSNDENFFKVSD